MKPTLLAVTKDGTGLRFTWMQFNKKKPVETKRIGTLPKKKSMKKIVTYWWNLRFNLGYRIGGFTSAKREY